MGSTRHEEAAELLRLLDAPTVGPRRALKRLAETGSAAEVTRQLIASPSTSPAIRVHLQQTGLDQYLTALEETLRLGGDFKLWSDPDYPANLAHWDARPPILFYKGDLKGLHQRALALVGRVDPSDEGIAAAMRFARKCVANEIQVISGLAKGIDGASHRGALAPPAGVTFAVLGHGLDYAYPKENQDLYAAIPVNGALISQFRTGVGPQKWTFPARNEVMCTLALGTVIVEAKDKCGSIIQAEFSFKHGRPVFVLGRNLKAPDSAWAHELVRRGAHVVERFDQVLEVVSRQEDFVGSTAPVADPFRLFDTGRGQKATAQERNRGDGGVTHGVVGGFFDVDGVIVDTQPATAKALASIAERHTGRPVDAETLNVTGKPHEVLGHLGVEHAYEIYRAEYDREFAKSVGQVRVHQAVVDALTRLKADGVRLAAITAQPRRRLDIILPQSVRRLFDLVLAYNDTGGKKDVGISAALRRLGVRHQDAFFVGDQPTDLAAARKAGVRGVGVLWGYATEAELLKWPHDVLLGDQTEMGPELLEMLSEPT